MDSNLHPTFPGNRHFSDDRVQLVQIKGQPNVNRYIHINLCTSIIVYVQVSMLILQT